MTPPKAPIKNMSAANPRGIGVSLLLAGSIESNSKDFTMIQAKNGPPAIATKATTPSARVNTPVT
jgi:hypothetical protein